MGARRVYFVCGTDTGVGKTCVSVALLCAAAACGKQTLGLKPLASGGLWQDGVLVNEDALQLMQASTVKLPYAQVNPLCLPLAVAPHIAAAHAGRTLSLPPLLGRVRGALATPADLVLIEGAGGWRVPLNEQSGLCLSALPQALACPVIMVVGLRLGCLNHALLTASAIAADGLSLVGWIGSTLDPAMQALEENIAALHRLLSAPCMGILPWALPPHAGALAIERLLG